MKNSSVNPIHNQLSDTENIELKEILFLIKKYFFLILYIMLGTIIGSIFITFGKTPVYEASTTVAIEEPTQTQTIFDFGTEYVLDLMNNEIQIIISRTLAEKVIQNLLQNDEKSNMYLFRTRKYSPKGLQKIIQDLKYIFIEAPKTKPSSIFTRQLPLGYFNQIVKTLQRSFSVENVRNTNILKLTIKNNDPKEAALIVNTIARTYQARDLEWSAGEIINLRSFLSEQLNVIKLDLRAVEDELKDFSEQEKIYGLEGNAQLMLTQLSNIESKYYNIRAELTIIKERSKYINNKLSKEEQTLSNKLLNSIDNRLFALRNQIAQNESDLVKNITIYGENHEAVRTIQRKIDRLKTELATQTQDLITQGISVADPLKYRQALIDTVLAIDAQESILQSRAEQYKKLVDQYSNQLNTLPAKSLQYARLERDRIILAETYSLMRQKFEEARISEASELGKVRIIDTAIPPKLKSKPNTRIDLFIGLLLGAGMSFLVIYVKEKLDHTLKSSQEIENLGISVIGIIPGFLNYKNKTNNQDKIATKANKKIHRRIFITKEPMSPVSEAFRSLRTNLIYASDKKIKKSIIVSSPGPNEGKTTVVANLAIAFAHTGKSTLLIDADLRRPRLHHTFELINARGLADYLTGVIDNYNDVIQPTDIGNLSVLTSGIIPSNPSEYLGSEKMANLIATLEERWDIILIDSPPIVAVTDAMIISKSIDSLVLVVRAGQTEADALIHSVSIIKHIGATLSGAVLNGLSRSHSYSSYYYYHHYYYDDKFKKK